MRWIPRKYALTCGRERVAEGAWRFKCRHITAVPSPRGDLVCLVGDTAWRCFDAATFEPLHGAVRGGRDGRTIGAVAWCDESHLLVCGEDELSRWDARVGEKLEACPVVGWNTWMARPLSLSASGMWAIGDTTGVTVGHAFDLGASRRVEFAASGRTDHPVDCALSPDGAALLAYVREGANRKVLLCDLLGRTTDIVLSDAPGLRLDRAFWVGPEELYFGTLPPVGASLGGWVRGREATALRVPDGVADSAMATWLCAIDEARDRVLVARMSLDATAHSALWSIDRAGQWVRVHELDAVPTDRRPAVAAAWIDGRLVVAQLVAPPSDRAPSGCRVTIDAGTRAARSLWLATSNPWNALLLDVSPRFITVRADNMQRGFSSRWTSWMVELP